MAATVCNAIVILALALAATAATNPAAKGGKLVTVRVALHQENLQAMHDTLMSLSDPSSPRYGQWLSPSQLRDLAKPSATHIAAASDYLARHGASDVQLIAAGDFLSARVPHTKLAALLEGADRPTSVEHVFVPKRTSLQTVPRSSVVAKHIQAGQRTNSSAIAGPNAQKASYGLPETQRATNSTCLQMVWGTGTYGYLESDLTSFYKDLGVPGDVSKASPQGFKGKPGGDNFGEASLDLDYISSMGLGCSTVVVNSNDDSDTEWSTGFGPAELAFMTDLASQTVVPQVLSLSLGSLSYAACDLLCEQVAAQGSISLKDCQAFTQAQRQVCMFTSLNELNLTNTAFMKLGLRGVSIVAASGDGGSHFSFEYFDETSPIGRALNNVSCHYSVPTFPSASPYVTSVGGTQWTQGADTPVPWVASGGGFSWQFGRLSYQNDAVQAYYNSAKLPPTSSFNPNGRGYPDVAAVADKTPMVTDGQYVVAGGTSASTPSFGGIITLINDLRRNAGLPVLGFLNPRIYQIAASHPGEAFYDMTTGNSACNCGTNCCPEDLSFVAAKGWDPLTGLGSPLWKGLVQYLASDQDLPRK